MADSHRHLDPDAAPSFDLSRATHSERTRDRQGHRRRPVRDFWTQWGLDTSKRFAVITMASGNVADNAPTVVAYESTMSAAKTTRDANAGSTIIANDYHADVPTEQGGADLSDEWYDADDPNVWWR